eukprot:5357240-Prymnesium_polylepis.1
MALDAAHAVELVGGHSAGVTALAAHPSRADLWVSCGVDGQLLLWEAGVPVPRLRVASLGRGLRCVALSPSPPELIAAGSDDGRVHIFAAPA